MMKVFLLIAALCAVAVTANPGATGEWRWKFRTPTVTPNIRALPLHNLFKEYPKQIRVPGTKSVEGCGMSSVTTNSNERIVGGQEVVPHTYPWQVALYVDDAWFCGGTIISDEYVLTAGHCLDGAALVEVVAGAHDLTIPEASQETYVSTDLTVHADYNSLLLLNDVALLRLPSPITFNEYISPVCLPSYSDAELMAGDAVVPTGWGKLSDGIGGISPILMQVFNDAISNDDCEAIYGIVTPTQICTDTTGGHGTCSGDSGGPLNYVAGGVTYTRGVTSFGPSAGCESGLPDGFSRVSSFLDWIEAQTGILIDP